MEENAAYPSKHEKTDKKYCSKAVYEIWKKQVKGQMPKCLLILSYTALGIDIRVDREKCHSLFFVKCNIRGLPLPILNIPKIGKRTATDGRKRKILYRIEWTNLSEQQGTL